MKQMSRKIVSVVLAFMMVVSLGQSMVLAADDALTIADGETYVVSETMELSSLTIGEGAAISGAEGYLVSLVVDGAEVAMDSGTYEGEIVLVLSEDYSAEPLGSFAGRGGELFRAGLFVDANGINTDKSIEEVIEGTYTDTSAEGLSIDAGSDNFNAIIIDGTEYTISDTIINLIGEGSGLDSEGNPNISDFSGLGSAIAAYDDAKVTLDNVEIYTSGVARPALFTDEGSDTLMTDSIISSMGGTLYDGYINSADQVYMIAPPWVLGITGNARTTNLMGEYSTAAFVRTDATANQWGVLSSDSGQNMVMTVVDSTLTLAGEGQENDPYSTNYGSGYGTYIIGNAQEFFYGVEFNVGTYASILTGGLGYYGSSDFDTLDVYPLVADGESVVYDETPVFTGIEGQGNLTVINSDAFGFMAHNSGTLTVTDGTIVNTDNAVFLMKNGDVSMEVSDGAEINVEDGVLLQIIDNDDQLVGVDWEQPLIPTFNTEFNEAAGYPGLDYSVAVTTEMQNTYDFTATDVTLDGSIYNGSGYFGGQAADILNVTLGSGSKLTGDITSSTVMHVDENGEQNTHFTIDEYYYLGHVANEAYYNGGNDVNVVLKDGAYWTPVDTSYISSLSIDAASSIVAPNGKVVSVYVDGVKQTIAYGEAYDFAGDIKVVVTSNALPSNIGSVDLDVVKILTEKTASPELWIQFIQDKAIDPTGQYLEALIKKLVK